MRLMLAYFLLVGAAALAADESVEQFQLVTQLPGNETRARFSPDGKHVALAAEIDGNFEIVIKSLGAEMRRTVAPSPAYDSSPAWSPDGSSIAFTSDRDGTVQIWTVELASGKLTRITSGDSTSYGADYSPDGQWLVHTGNASGNWDIWATRIASGEQRRITRHDGNEYWPRISRDGKRVVFYSTWSGWTDLWIADFESGELHPLLVSEAEDYRPAWSPDGSQVVFSSDRSGTSDLWAVDVAGGAPYQPVQLTNDTAGQDYADWSPDGRTILFDFDDSRESVFKIPVTGGNPERLTDDRFDDVSPVESSNGKIAFVSNRTPAGEFGIFTTDADTINPANIFPDRFNRYSPSFSPDGLSMSYQQGGGDYSSHNIFVTDFENQSTRQLTDSGRVQNSVWCADGKSILYGYSELAYDGKLQLWHVPAEGGKAKMLEERIITSTSPFDCSSDGIALYAVTTDKGPVVHRINVHDGSAEALFSGGWAAWSPDGSSLVTISDKTGNDEIYLTKPDGSAARQLTDTPWNEMTPRFAADGKSILYSVARRNRSIRALDIGNTAL